MSSMEDVKTYWFDPTGTSSSNLIAGRVRLKMVICRGREDNVTETHLTLRNGNGSAGDKKFKIICPAWFLDGTPAQTVGVNTIYDLKENGILFTDGIYFNVAASENVAATVFSNSVTLVYS